MAQAVVPPAQKGEIRKELDIAPFVAWETIRISDTIAKSQGEYLRRKIDMQRIITDSIQLRILIEQIA